MIDFINSLISQYHLFAIFIFMMSNGFLSAPPSELILTFAGLLALRTEYSLLQTLLVAIAGNLLGTYLLFLIGQRIGYKWLISAKMRIQAGNFIVRWAHVLIPEEKTILLLYDRLRDRGAIWVCIFRCLPCVRSIISLPAGMLKMQTMIFIIYSTVGITIWAVMWQGCAYFVGNNWIKYGNILSGILFIPLVFLLVIMKRKIKRYLK